MDYPGFPGPGPQGPMIPPVGFPPVGGMAPPVPPPSPFPADPYSLGFLGAPPPPPPEPVEIYDEPTKKFQDEAFEYVAEFCKQSRDFAKKKQPRWQLEAKLLRNELSQKDLVVDELANTANQDVEAAKKQPDHRTDFVYPLAPIYAAQASSAFKSIFSGPDPIIVQAIAPEDAADIPTSLKLQQLLMDGLSEGRMATNLYSTLLRMPAFGSQYGKIFWHAEKVPIRRLNPETGQVEEKTEIVRECPIIEPVELDMILVDWKAKHQDIQRWRGIGHRAQRTYDDVLSRFAQGTYHLNLEKVVERWDETGSGLDEDAQRTDYDPDTASIDESRIARWLEVWEWHGRVPSKSMGRSVECCVVFVTDIDAGEITDPHTGVLVRLTTRPVLHCGRRPFVGGTRRPEPPGPFGQSMREAIRPLHALVSSLGGQINDIARFTAAAALGSRANVDWKGDLSLYPGRIIEGIEPGDIFSLKLGDGNLGPILQAWEVNLDLLKKATATDMLMGQSAGRKSATEASSLLQQSQIPFQAELELFVRDYLEPALNICLELYRQFSVDDRIVMIKGAGGQLTPTTLTAEELYKGRYRVKVTLTAQDATTVAKAQVIQQVLPIFMQALPILQQTGWDGDLGELYQRLFDLLRIDGVDRILQKLPPPPPMPPPDPNAPPGMMPPGQGPPPQEGPPMGMNGGPMGPEPTDMNQQAQMLQMQSAPNTELGPQY